MIILLPNGLSIANSKGMAAVIVMLAAAGCSADDGGAGTGPTLRPLYTLAGDATSRADAGEAGASEAEGEADSVDADEAEPSRAPW